MEVSRILFTKETREKMEKGLNSRQKGKLRWEKLKEAEANGRLGMAKSRYDLGRLVGYSEADRKKGYQWACNMIQRGHIKEHIYEFDSYGRAVYEYHLGTEPDFDASGVKNAKRRNPLGISSSRPPVTSLKERGKAMYGRLKSLAESGEINKARSRNELAKLTDTSRSWVCGMIERGFVKENFVRYENGLPTYNYSLTDREPNYNNVKVNKNTPLDVATPEEKPEERKAVVWIDESAKDVRSYKLEFSRGDTTVRVELDDYDKVVELIKTILKGE